MVSTGKSYQTFLKIALWILVLASIGYGAYLSYFLGSFGFGDYQSPKIDEGVVFERAKTLWDWLNLLIIPLILTFGAIAINNSTQRNIKLREEERVRLEKEKIEQRENFERWLKYDSAREQTLQEYLAVMQELILEKGLRETTQTNPVNEIARARTLDIVRRLDGERKRLVLDFLYQTGLIYKANPYVSLIAASFGVNPTPLITSDTLVHQNPDFLDNVARAANLQQIYLINANLVGAVFCDVIFVNANLKGTDFTEANLENANLSGADLKDAIFVRAKLISSKFTAARAEYANFQDADLNNSSLNEAILQGANFQNADLRHAKFKYASLIGADLRNANLADARLDHANLIESNISKLQLDVVRSYTGAILPPELMQN